MPSVHRQTCTLFLALYLTWKSISPSSRYTSLLRLHVSSYAVCHIHFLVIPLYQFLPALPQHLAWKDFYCVIFDALVQEKVTCFLTTQPAHYVFPTMISQKCYSHIPQLSQHIQSLAIHVHRRVSLSLLKLFSSGQSCISHLFFCTDNFMLCHFMFTIVGVVIDCSKYSLPIT